MMLQKGQYDKTKFEIQAMNVIQSSREEFILGTSSLSLICRQVVAIPRKDGVSESL
jgi:hypothetical protein